VTVGTAAERKLFGEALRRVLAEIPA
jgi:hypothetical protein